MRPDAASTTLHSRAGTQLRGQLLLAMAAACLLALVGRLC